MLELLELCYHPLLHRIQATFHPGKIYGILGPNGSGKTTLLKNIKKIWTPTSGTVLWRGESLHQKERREIAKAMAFVPQQPEHLFGFTIDEFIEMGGYCREKQDPLYKEELLRRLGLHSLKNRPLPSLSGGEQQRAYLARSLYTEAPVLLLDEPNSNLDFRHRHDLWTLLLAQKERGKTVIITLHDLNAATTFCDELLILFDGRIQKMGPPSLVLTPDTLQEVWGIFPLEISAKPSGVQNEAYPAHTAHHHR